MKEVREKIALTMEKMRAATGIALKEIMAIIEGGVLGLGHIWKRSGDK